MCGHDKKKKLSTESLVYCDTLSSQTHSLLILRPFFNSADSDYCCRPFLEDLMRRRDAQTILTLSHNKMEKPRPRQEGQTWRSVGAFQPVQKPWRKTVRESSMRGCHFQSISGNLSDSSYRNAPHSLRSCSLSTAAVATELKERPRMQSRLWKQNWVY
jgi:hypothetical protein